MSNSTDAADRIARTTVKEERARDAARAMREYQAERLAVLARTERLRALRLAKEAEEAQKKALPKKARAKKTVKKGSPT